MPSRKSNHCTFPNPPREQEIMEARKFVTEILTPGMDLDKDPDPPVMRCWRGEGWHRDEIYFGILIGLQIAKARRGKEEAKS